LSLIADQDSELSLQAECTRKAECWAMQASYSEEKLSFGIDAAIGSVSSFRVEKAPWKG
jgi:hypothetical protein